MVEDAKQPEDESGFISPSKPIKVGRHKPEKEEKPGTLNERLTHQAQALSDNLFERRGGLRKTVGEPFKGAQLSAADRKQQYRVMISSKELLTQALVGAAIIGRDGALRIRNDMVTAFLELSEVDNG